MKKLAVISQSGANVIAVDEKTGDWLAELELSEDYDYDEAEKDMKSLVALLGYKVEEDKKAKHYCPIKRVQKLITEGVLKTSGQEGVIKCTVCGEKVYT